MNTLISSLLVLYLIGVIISIYWAGKINNFINKSNPNSDFSPTEMQVKVFSAFIVFGSWLAIKPLKNIYKDIKNDDLK